MSTKVHATKSVGHVIDATSHASAHDVPVATQPLAPAVATPPETGTTASGTATVFVGSPPADANIPKPPEGYVPAPPGEFRNIVPRAAELTALPQALIELNKFTDYAQVFGGAAPSLAEVLEGFTLGSQWSKMRATTETWDGYCVLQEGYSWKTIRLLIARLGPVFAVAIRANPKLVSRFPGLTALLGAKKAIAQKGASTRRLNKQAMAEGMPPIHGVVGKKRQRKAAKEALAAASTASATPAGSAPAAALPAAPSPAPVSVATPSAVNAVNSAPHA